MQASRLLKGNKLLNFVLILALIFGVVSIPTGIADANSITASNVLLNPTVIVKVSENEIRTYLWTKGTKVRLTIDDPANGIGIDYSETLPVLEGSNLAKDLLFKLNDFELRPGQLITLTDGTNIDTVLISPINITNIDSPTPNTIYGTGQSGSLIYLKIDTETKSINLQAKVGTDGTWFVNAGSEFSIATILKITCSITDSDKDIVYFTGPIKKPHFEANLSLNTIEGWDWQFGKMLTVKIDDPENGVGFDFSGTTLMNESYFYPRFVLDLGTFKLAADQTVTVSDGTITKKHVLRGLAITDVDFETDLIKGTTDTKDEIHTWISDSNGQVIKRTNSVKKGLWTSDFAHSGDQSWEVDTFDITESTKIFSKQVDEDGDATLVTFIAAGNLPPIARVGEDITAETGTTLTFDGSTSSDPEGNLLTFEWDMDNDGVFDDATGMNPTAVFEEEGVYPIVLRVKDDGGLTSTDSLSVTIKSSTSTINLPPIAEAGEDIVAGNAITVIFNGSFSTDPEGKPLTYDWDMDNDGQFDDATGMNPSQVFTRNGVYLIALRVTDDGNLTATDTLSITISLADPSLGEIVMPASPLKVNSNLMFSAPITNPGQDDTLSAIWDWNDGMTSAGIMDGQSITGSHQYQTPGFYTVTLTLSNKDGGITQKSIDKMVVVAPSAASVFGIGWLISPAGSTNANLREIGKINFDFNASYRRTSVSVPTGKTNITIKGKDFKFVSSSYSWLIINGKTSILEGSGTLNGGGNFGLLISIQDGAWFKPNSDKLRIKIWNKENGEVIYDTQPGAANDALPTTTVKGFIFTINK